MRLPSTRPGWPRAPWRPWLARVVPLCVLIAAGYVLQHELSLAELAGIWHRALQIAPAGVLAAVALTVASYACLTGYDLLALSYIGRSLPYRRAALTAVVAYGLGHNLSLGALTGAAVRHRMYSRHGLTMADIAAISVFCAITTAIGVATLAGASLALAPFRILTLSEPARFWIRVVGAGLLAAVALYLFWAARARHPIVVLRMRLRPAGTKIALAQLLVSAVDFVFAAAALWVLLPERAGVGFVGFAALYALAVIASILSNIPGGIGVFESVFVYGLRDIPTDALLGSLVVYRAVYYLLPLVVAALLLAWHEIRTREWGLGRLSRVASVVLAPVAPQLSAALVFLCGMVLLLSGATPAIDARVAQLRHLVPLPLLELSHLTASVIGLALLILARGLLRRVSAAYQLVFWLLAVGTVASLAKGLDFEEAALLGGVWVVVWLGRDAFYRSSSLIRERFSPRWIVSVAAIVALSLLIAALDRRVPYSHELWWTFARSADAPRTLRASLAVAVLAGAFFAANLMRPARAAAHDPRALDIERARRAIARSDETLGNAALTADKRLLFHPQADAFVMYQVSGASWIALGDPVGRADCVDELVRRFCQLVDRAGGRPVFYEISARFLPVYIDNGLSLAKLGEEARVALGEFSLEGSKRADLRQAHARARRQGATFELVAARDTGACLPDIERISSSWLSTKTTAEKQFSVGSFSPAYLRQFPLALIRIGGRPVAFANVWATATREELSIDLMRFDEQAPRNAMDFLFIELMLWGRAQGYRWFNLGIVPLAGLERHPLAPAWHRLGNFVFRHGEHFYNFEGLKLYKQKFAPQWQPRYLASRGTLALPAALLDSSRLIAGGWKGLVAK